MVIGVDKGPHGTEEVTIYTNTNKVISTVGPVPPAAPQEQLPSTTVMIQRSGDISADFPLAVNDEPA